MTLCDALTAAFLKWLAAALQSCRPPLPPDRPRILSHTEIPGMALGFRYHLAAPTDSDPTAVKFKLKVKINGTASPDVDVAPADTPSVDAPDGAAVVIVYTALDAAGNESAPSPELAFTAKDDIPPAAPGAPTVTAHEQITLPDAPTPPTPPAA